MHINLAVFLLSFTGVLGNVPLDVASQDQVNLEAVDILDKDRISPVPLLSFINDIINIVSKILVNDINVSLSELEKDLSLPDSDTVIQEVKVNIKEQLGKYMDELKDDIKKDLKEVYENTNIRYREISLNLNKIWDVGSENMSIEVRTNLIEEKINQFEAEEKKMFEDANNSLVDKINKTLDQVSTNIKSLIKSSAEDIKNKLPDQDPNILNEKLQTFEDNLNTKVSNYFNNVQLIN
ncbi:putative SP-containing protein [Vairimorpha necatrix]|uniref:SP-containing protein n=1 Tax=Vairimorpha necatrix TaxID=6039 RepID=A0AAX4JEM6_9MICR